MECAFFWHAFVPRRTCKKHTVSDSTEAEMISYAGLRWEGIPALTSWDLVIDVLEPLVGRDSTHTTKPKKTKSLMADKFTEINRQHRQCSSKRAQLQPTGIAFHFFEDNDAVIKMIIKGSSPTMRHIYRTHCVNWDWLFIPTSKSNMLALPNRWPTS